MQLAQAIDAWVEAHGTALSASTQRNIRAITTCVKDSGWAELPCHEVDEGVRSDVIYEAGASTTLTETAINEFLTIVLQWESEQAAQDAPFADADTTVDHGLGTPDEAVSDHDRSADEVDEASDGLGPAGFLEADGELEATEGNDLNAGDGETDEEFEDEVALDDDADLDDAELEDLDVDDLVESDDLEPKFEEDRGTGVDALDETNAAADEPDEDDEDDEPEALHHQDQDQPDEDDEDSDVEVTLGGTEDGARDPDEEAGDDEPVDEDAASSFFSTVSSSSADLSEDVTTPIDNHDAVEISSSKSTTGVFSAAAEQVPTKAATGTDWVTVMYFSIAAICFILVIIFQLAN